MRLARVTGDAAGMLKALDLKRRELELYPNNAQGWFEWARMTVPASQAQPDRPDLLRLGLEYLDKAEALDKARPDYYYRRFDQAQLLQVRQIREYLARRLAATTQQAGTPSAR